MESTQNSPATQSPQTTQSKNNKAVSILTASLIFAIGLVLIICNKSITGEGVIVLAGVLFLVTGIINIVLYLTRRNEDGARIHQGFSLFMGWLVSVGAIILGICMLIFTPTFGTMIPVIFGILIFLGCIMLALTMLIGVNRVVRVPAWMWLYPGLMMILGVVTLLQEPTVNDPLIMILTGVAMLIFGFAAFSLGILLAGVKRSRKREETLSTQTHDVEAKEVKSE